MKERWEVRGFRGDDVPPEVHTGGKMLGMGIVTKFILDREEPKRDELIAMHRQRKAAGLRGLISYTHVTRNYTRPELAAATLFTLAWSGMFEPAGEECGTKYDGSTACPNCGAGRTPNGPLRLRASSLPKRKDIAFTIAREERVVSERVAEIIRGEGLTGVELDEVEFRSRSTPRARWFRWRVTGTRYAFDSRTRFANSDVDPRNSYACPLGDTAGHHLASEVFVSATVGPRTDVGVSQQYEGGVSSGLIVPWRIDLVSPRFRQVMLANKVRGWSYEVAYQG